MHCSSHSVALMNIQVKTNKIDIIIKLLLNAMTGASSVGPGGIFPVKR